MAERKVYGIAEIAEALGMQRQTVAKWHQRGKLPEPDEELAMGPVWHAETIEPWMLANGIPAYHAEWEMDGACIVYPVTITTGHAASSYGQPVVVILGDPRGPGDMPPGELQLSAAVHGRLAERLRRIGYLVCDQPIDEYWLSAWEHGKPVEDHWHPAARLVMF